MFIYCIVCILGAKNKFNLVKYYSNPKIVRLPRISGYGPFSACFGCLLYILPTRAWRVHVMRVHGDGGVYTRRIKRGHRA